MAWAFRVLRFFISKRLKYRVFLEERQAENLQNLTHTPLTFQLLAHDGHQYVDTDRHPHLRLHRVLARAVETFDAQVLFDPLEEQFRLPAMMPPKSKAYIGLSARLR